MTRRIGEGLLVLGGSAVGVAAAGAWVPLLHLGTEHVSVSTAHGLCSSTLGQYVQAVSGRVQLDCTAVTAGYWGALIVGIAGLVLVVVGIIRISAERVQRPTGRDQRPPYPPGQGSYPQQPYQPYPQQPYVPHPPPGQCPQQPAPAQWQQPPPSAPWEQQPPATWPGPQQ